MNDGLADLPDRQQVALSIGRILVPPDQTVARHIRELRACCQQGGEVVMGVAVTGVNPVTSIDTPRTKSGAVVGRHAPSLRHKLRLATANPALMLGGLW